MNNTKNVPSFRLPNGVTIFAESCGDVDGAPPVNGWAEIVIYAQYPNGDLDDLCYVQFEKDTEKLAIRAFNGLSEDPAYECHDFQFAEMEE